MNCDGIHLRRKIRAPAPPIKFVLFSSNPYWFQKQSCVLKEKKFSRSRRCISVNHVFIAKKTMWNYEREKRGWFINRNLPQQTGCAQFHRRSSDLRGTKKTFESSWTSRERNTTVKSLPFSPQWKKGESEGLSVAKAKRRKKEAKLHWNKLKHTKQHNKNLTISKEIVADRGRFAWFE